MSIADCILQDTNCQGSAIASNLPVLQFDGTFLLSFSADKMPGWRLRQRLHAGTVRSLTGVGTLAVSLPQTELARLALGAFPPQDILARLPEPPSEEAARLLLCALFPLRNAHMHLPDRHHAPILDAAARSRKAVRRQGRLHPDQPSHPLRRRRVLLQN